MRWKVFEEENIADIKVEVYGKSELDLLSNIIDAFSSIIVDSKKIKIKDEFKVAIRASNFEELVFSFVERLILLKDVCFFIPKKGELKIEDNFLLSGTLLGERISSDLSVKIDIKALTYHKFSVRKNRVWKAVMVFDI